MYYQLERLARGYLSTVKEQFVEAKSQVELYWQSEGLPVTLPLVASDSYMKGQVPDSLVMQVLGDSLPAVTVEAVSLSPVDDSKPAMGVAEIAVTIYSIGSDPDEADTLNMRLGGVIATILQEYAPSGCGIKDVGEVTLGTSETVASSMSVWLKKAVCTLPVYVAMKQ